MIDPKAARATSVCVLHPQLQGYSNLLENCKDSLISYVLDVTLNNNKFKSLDHRVSLDPARLKEFKSRVH